MRVLGLETSCDETAAAIVDASGVRSELAWTQEVHAAWGGVVPELAARAHLERLGAVVAAVLSEAGVDRPDAVAATAGPGLIGAVLVGFSAARALASAWDVPFKAVHHLEGHLLAAQLEPVPPPWPHLCLVVSGGHTTLYRAARLGEYEVLGASVDDAAGEAYDKVARMLGLGYPGGPRVDALAATGDPAAVALPRPLPGQADMSFSGLKTAVRQHLEKPGRASDADVCASFQAAVIDVLVLRVERAVRATGVRHVTLGGGVAANRGLRAALTASAARCGYGLTLPAPARCTDNAAMIAVAGRLRLLAEGPDSADVGARAAWSLA
ncbi:MAG: tRNA ((37)-N6)-threonylcarbamoyltransferase complex transferase subunit TsaD [Pseudomonadota bacterium]|jgi:N6-L-threonylcarbamoyladenine synthase